MPLGIVHLRMMFARKRQHTQTARVHLFLQRQDRRAVALSQRRLMHIRLPCVAVGENDVGGAFGIRRHAGPARLVQRRHAPPL